MDTLLNAYAKYTIKIDHIYYTNVNTDYCNISLAILQKFPVLYFILLIVFQQFYQCFSEAR